MTKSFIKIYLIFHFPVIVFFYRHESSVEKFFECNHKLVFIQASCKVFPWKTHSSKKLSQQKRKWIMEATVFFWCEQIFEWFWSLYTQFLMNKLAMVMNRESSSMSALCGMADLIYWNFMEILSLTFLNEINKCRKWNTEGVFWMSALRANLTSSCGRSWTKFQILSWHELA